MTRSKDLQMKSKLSKRQPGEGAMAFLTRFCNTADQSIPGFRTALLMTGLVAAAFHVGKSADFLFGTGLMLQCAIWFENWWIAPRHH